MHFSCDQCEFIKHHATCRMCRIRFEAARKNLEKKDAEVKEKLTEQSKRVEMI